MERLIVLVLEGVLELVKELANEGRESVTIEDLLEAVEDKMGDYDRQEGEVLDILKSI